MVYTLYGKGKGVREGKYQANPEEGFLIPSDHQDDQVSELTAPVHMHPQDSQEDLWWLLSDFLSRSAFCLNQL